MAVGFALCSAIARAEVATATFSSVCKRAPETKIMNGVYLMIGFAVICLAVNAVAVVDLARSLLRR